MLGVTQPPSYIRLTAVASPCRAPLALNMGKMVPGGSFKLVFARGQTTMLISTAPQNCWEGRDSKRTGISLGRSNSDVKMRLLRVADDQLKTSLAIKPAPIAVQSSVSHLGMVLGLNGRSGRKLGGNALRGWLSMLGASRLGALQVEAPRMRPPLGLRTGRGRRARSALSSQIYDSEVRDPERAIG